MKKDLILYKNIFWATVALLVIALSFSLLFQTDKEPIELTISELANKINEEQVEKITVQGNNLLIDLKGDERAVAQKESELGLSETLNNYGVEGTALQSVTLEIQDESGFKFWMSILIPTLLPLIIIVGMFWFIFRQAKGGANQAFNFGKSKLKMFGNFKGKISFNDVAGLKEAKQELREVVEFLKDPKKFLKMGARIPRGVLLVGPPGTGKTLLARATAGESGVPFFYLSASEFVEMFVGVGASRTRDAFQTAKNSAPAILFIDEIDAVGRERGAGLGGGHDEREQTLNQILVEMDGFDRDANVIILAATNRPDILDRALLRPGRFDRRVMLDLPDIRDREEILKIHGRGKPLEKNIDLRSIAVRTPGFSGADLANLMNEAAILAARENKTEITQLHLYSSIEKVLLGPERKNKVTTEKEREITAYHEAGHALVAASLKDADPVHKVSIISRGRAGGYTLKLPTEEINLRNRSQFISEIAVALGGYAAEQVVFGEMSTGASNDLRQLSKLARELVTQYGMSDRLGPQTFGHSHDLIFLGKEMSDGRDYSESVASKIDEEVKRFIDKAYNVTKKIINSRKKVLDKIAKELLEKETIEKEEFDKIIESFKLKSLSI
ncbi:ATP-dependent metallopeptidase FtsH/Yme1/Tma family protein [Candidatus Wolfebacteria bacterium]|nr:ATP-dependent metallopeptidase FtsH/Yme1/Tma family protein [Candidatus Wolfebacteria bacterium]